MMTETEEVPEVLRSQIHQGNTDEPITSRMGKDHKEEQNKPQRKKIKRCTASPVPNPKRACAKCEPGGAQPSPCPHVGGAARAASASPPPSPGADSDASDGGGRPPEPADSFSWDELMRQPAFAAAPVACFKHAPMSATWHHLTAGLKVEVAYGGGGRRGERRFWVGTVLQVQGYRGLVRLEGLSADAGADRWLDLCSADMKPVGWCAARDLPLTPPPAAEPRADWQRLLVRRLTGTRTLPAGFHRKALASLGSQLRAGQTVEVVDKGCIGRVRAATITRVIGRRLHVQYLDAPDDDGGFWCHENSPLVHPVGWALAVGHRLSAPDDYLRRCETGRYLPSDATEDCLPAPPPVTHEGFKVGMKLEALDPLNLNSIGVATVNQVLGNHFLMVRLETYAPELSRGSDDWFCYHASSPYIFPPGFCRTVGVPLTPPHGYAADTFSWEAYLAAEGGARPAPAQLFQRPPLSHGFQPGHRLEAVDLMDPQLVCVATVAAVVGRLLRVHFDGWEEQFDQWVDAASPDIFPVGWCRLVGYRLEPPRAGRGPAAPCAVPRTRRRRRRAPRAGAPPAAPPPARRGRGGTRSRRRRRGMRRAGGNRRRPPFVLPRRTGTFAKSRLRADGKREGRARLSSLSTTRRRWRSIVSCRLRRSSAFSKRPKRRVMKVKSLPTR